MAQNGDAFDIKKINTRFLEHGITPPSPYKTIDTLKVAKSKFAFNSFKLDDMARNLEEGRKVRHRGFDMWRGCMAGKASDWRAMKVYNKRDVDLLARLYRRFLPWLKMPVTLHDGKKCPRCGSTKFHRRGYSRSKTSIYAKYICFSCGGWSQGEVTEKFGKIRSA